MAGEKAGTLNPGKLVISAEQHEKALTIFKQISCSRNAPLYYLPKILAFQDVQFLPHRTNLRVAFQTEEFSQVLFEVRIPMPGEI
jgi:folylpolyglutamate synthase/dihydropteroate synthase